MNWTRRSFLLGTGAVLGAAGTRVVTAPSLQRAGFVQPGGGEGVLNDASGLSETPVFRHAVFQGDDASLEARLRAELREAQAAGRALNIGAARHSMGGHAIPREGHAISLEGSWVGLDRGSGTMRVLAGTRWRDAIRLLDAEGFSPKVMQSNNDFGVAATFSVNAHGWPTAFGPMGSTVRSIEMMLADGTVLSASRQENPELFRAAMGGYGLIGLITSLEVEVAPNALLEPSFCTLAAADFGPAFAEAAQISPMTYGRLSVDRESFLEEALIVTYAPVEGEIPPAGGSGFLSRASRPIFRAQVGSEWTKRRRW